MALCYKFEQEGFMPKYDVKYKEEKLAMDPLYDDIWDKKAKLGYDDEDDPLEAYTTALID